MAGSAFAVGTVHTITLGAVSIVLGAAAVSAWWRSEPIKVRPAATLLLITGGGLVGYTLLQCIPLPASLIAVIAPHTADVWARALSPLREPGPRWVPLTLDPPATHIEVLRGVAYLLAFITALRIAHRRAGVTFLSSAIIITGLLLALAAMLHPAFGAKRLFGIYEPGPGVAESHIAPLLNPNNLAAYINLSFCLILATSLSQEPRFPRAIAIVLTVLLAAAQVWVASRGGVIAMLIGAGTVVALSLSERVRRRDPSTWLTVGCGAAILIGGIFIVVGTSAKAKGELLITDVSKFAVLLEVARMLPAYGVFGVGRGAFESIFARFREEPGHLTVTNPENIVAQWIAEWGLPVGLLGLVIVVLALRPTAALARSRTAAGAWAALAAVAAQNMADFSSEIPGVMISVVVCAAIVVAGSAGRAPRWRFERWSRSPMTVAWVSVAIAGLAILLCLPSLGHHVHEDRKRLHDAALIHVLPVHDMRALARASMLRHPAEPYLPFAVALRATRARDDNPLPWLGAALERAPVYGAAHLLLARVVAPRAPSQARLEYRLALEQAPESTSMVVHEAPRLVAGFDDAMELVPAGASGSSMLYWLVLALTDRLPATCVRLDEELTKRDPSDPGPSRRAASSAVADLEAGDSAPWCEGSALPGCVDRALTLARKLESVDPVACDGYGLEARALARSGDTRRALTFLEHVVDRVNDRVTCLQLLARLAREAEDEPRFEMALNEIARAGCVDDKECVSNLVWVAQAHESRGSSRRALATYKRAFDRAPDDDDLLERMARLAGGAGLYAEALKDYQELARRHPKDARWAKAAEEQRDAMLRGVVKY